MPDQQAMPPTMPPARDRAPRIKIISRKRGTSEIGVEASSDAMLATLGTVELAAANWLLNHLINATHADSAKPVDEATVNGALALMHGIAPRDEAEGMLVAQMVATHAAAMDSLRRARQETFLPARDSFANFATRLLRTYAAQMETLKRNRSGGEQRMTVEHVHVHPGAQAVVGNVHRGRGGGGG
jgi:hypothetical protein